MITYERAHELLYLDAETGRLYWKVSKGRCRAGSRAGSLHHTGYRQIKIDGKLYKEHRIIFLMAYGYMPEHEVDHRNGIRDNNRPENLREVSRVCNMQNQCKRNDNTSGFPGVSWHSQKEKWRAQIVIRGKLKFLGLYDSALEAALARYTAEVWDDNWTCNHRSELVRAIQRAWPEFRPVGG